MSSNRKKRATRKKRKFPERDAYTLAELADRLGVSRPFLYRFIEDGSLRSFKLGGRRMVEAGEYHRFLNERTGGTA